MLEICASHPLSPLTEPTPVIGEGEGGGGGGKQFLRVPTWEGLLLKSQVQVYGAPLRADKVTALGRAA